MKLKTLTLNNFKKHKHLHIDFHSGSNAIMGPNYAGKSTILEAALVLLWGNKAGPVPADQLVNDDAKDFELIGTYTNGLVIRRTSRDSSMGRDDNAAFARGHTAVNKAVEEELGISRQTFMKVFTSQQGSPQQLLDMEGAELQRFIETCIEIDVLDGIVKESNRRANGLKGLMEAYAAALLPEDLFNQHQAELAQAQALLPQLTEAMANDHEILKDLQLQRNDLMADLAAAGKQNKLADQYQQLVSELESLSDDRTEIAVSNIEADLESVRFREHQLSTYHRAEKALQRIREDLSKLLSAPQPEEIQEVDTSDLQSQIKDWSVAIAGLSGEIRDSKSQLDSSSCSKCLRPFEMSADQIAGLKAAIANKQADLADAGDRLSTLQIALSNSEKINQQARLVSRQLEIHRRDLENLRKQEQQAWAEMPPAPTADASMLSELAAQLNLQLKQAQEHNASVRACIARRDNLQEKVNAFGCVPTHIDESLIHEAAKDVSTKIDACNVRLLDAQRTMGHTETLIGTLTPLLEAHQLSVGKVDSTSATIQQYKNIAVILSANRSRVVDDALTLVFAVATDFISTCTDGDISEVLMHEGSIAYKEGDRVRYKGSASGAQKSLIGVGMKLGLTKLVQTPFDCLLLDEVSADMDDEISMRCMLALSSFGQSVYVSHRQQDVADQVIMLER